MGKTLKDELLKAVKVNRDVVVFSREELDYISYFLKEHVKFLKDINVNGKVQFTCSYREEIDSAITIACDLIHKIDSPYKPERR